MNYLSDITRNYPASGIRKMFDLAEQYDDVIKLTVGEPNFDTPLNIKNAAKKAIDEGYVHYCHNSGLQDLREAIANKYNQYSNNYSYENVMITVGGMEAILLCLLSTVNRGDEIIVPNPCYPNYIGQIMLCGAKAVGVPVYEENDFNIKSEDIEKAITSKTKAILLNSPSNPLGSVLKKEEIIKIAEIAEKYDLLIFSDEVYDKIIFDNLEYFSLAQISEIKERVLIINSFSKSYAMTGWRLGYIVGSKEIISNMPRLQEGVVSCVPTFIQKAAIEAITGSQDSVNSMLADYTRRRDIIVNGLNNIPGISCKKPKGSFYVFPNIKQFGKSSEEFAEELIRHAKVVVVPGSAFGSMGEGYLRVVFANSDENLKEALRRISEYIKRRY
ncbi:MULTISPECIES: pyridoxal phosphate-dependent aminotransferase [unclassified Sedimentibacter]|uniref:pyridoxal phosphate-dependent aminotransferase n=1 Tax=unclassified Sedimentibacter TaxID=2649220 RepID=UPI0027E071E6|nr:pyridoxal phosphate-dependent aminotransferase [Sedimentibacter sp. MB35-C1]WMJ77544.1 pyridoxal phosphate-dependent aminotransferase [Sedimentibacter sp. MB35-C1]